MDPKACHAFALILLTVSIAAPVLADEPDAGAPMELPVVSPEQREAARARTLANGNRIVEYDLRTSMERFYEPAPPSQGPSPTISGSPGAWDRIEQLLDADKNFSNHSWVADPASGIYPKHIRLSITWDLVNGTQENGSCSGTLISPIHVITAGHCVRTFELSPTGFLRQPWAASARVQPGYNMGLGALGQANVTGFRSWTGWTNEADYDHDIAVLTLDRPLGAHVGWRGVGASSDWDHFDESTWEMFAYPGTNWDKSVDLGGERMYRQAGNYDYDDYPQIGSDMPSFRGTSGGGAIKNNAVWAVRSHLAMDWPDDVDTYDTAITHTKVADISAWIASDLPNGSDLVPLRVRADSASGVSGSTLSGVNFLAYNLGETDHTGGVLYTLRIGSASTTTPSHTYVYDGYYPGVIPAQGSVQINLPNVVIPLSLGTGDYFLGIQLTNADANGANNLTFPWETMPFSVVCASVAAPVLAFPENGHPCVPVNITLNWGSIPGTGVEYQVHLFRTADPTGTSQLLSITQHTFTNLLPDMEYQWRVRARTSCGGFGPWSSVFSFWTEGYDLTVPMLTPTDNEGCLDTDVLLTWSAVPKAELYRIRLRNVTTGVQQIFDTTALSYQLTNLDPNTEYLWSMRARDACLQFGPETSRISFFTTAAAAVTPTPVSPVQSAFSSIEPSFVTQYEPSAKEYHYELQTAAGAPVSSWVDKHGTKRTGLTGGDYRWRVRTLCCTAAGDVFSAWTDWQEFEVDDTPPILMYPPDPISPPLDLWTATNLITVDIQPATDNCCVAECWVSVDENPNGIPDGSIVVTDVGAYEILVGEGQLWFHVVAVDGNGNISEPQHLGPYLIDFAPPLVPEPVANIAPLTYSNVDKIDVSWPPAVDLGSGVAGYSFAWSTSPTYVLDGIIDTTELSTSLDPAPEGSRYFYLRAVDALGQASAVVQQRYYVDRTAPTFNNFEPDDFGSVAYNSIVSFFTPIQDFAQPVLVALHHFYSIDGGSSWYGAICASGLCQTNPWCPSASPQNCNVSTGNTQYSWRVPWVPPGSQLLYKIVAIDPAGNSGERISEQTFTVTGISPTDTPEVREFALLGNVPNPFNPRTTIRYQLPARSQVDLSIFDLSGRLVRTLVSEMQDGPAVYELLWDGIDAQGQPVASGNYFYRLKAGDFVQARRMTLLK